MRTRLLNTILLAAVCATFVGCKGSPSQRYEQGVKLYATVGEAAATAIDNDWVSLDTAEAIGRIDNEAYAELVASREALDSGDDAFFEWRFDRFRRLLSGIQRIVAEPGAARPEAEDPDTGGGETGPPD